MLLKVKSFGRSTDWVGERHMRWLLEIVKRNQEATGFHVLPRRWVVERTFGWFGRYRRLSKDYEFQTDTSENMILIAMIQLMVHRLTRTARRPSQTGIPKTRSQTLAERTSPMLASDVIRLSGMSFDGTSQTSPFVLEMTYNPSLLPSEAGSEGSWASRQIDLSWMARSKYQQVGKRHRRQFRNQCRRFPSWSLAQ